MKHLDYYVGTITMNEDKRNKKYYISYNMCCPIIPANAILYCVQHGEAFTGSLKEPEQYDFTIKSHLCISYKKYQGIKLDSITNFSMTNNTVLSVKEMIEQMQWTVGMGISIQKLPDNTYYFSVADKAQECLSRGRLAKQSKQAFQTGRVIVINGSHAISTKVQIDPVTFPGLYNAEAITLKIETNKSNLVYFEYQATTLKEAEKYSSLIVKKASRKLEESKIYKIGKIVNRSLIIPSRYTNYFKLEHGQKLHYKKISDECIRVAIYNPKDILTGEMIDAMTDSRKEICLSKDSYNNVKKAILTQRGQKLVKKCEVA